ncbi:CbtA family protein [Halopenitus persicus]|uniref:Probable cobalt transporter subunit (CbtA) n=1 Tax=Halopenitus persicus TaxID=1048396 RepID=A0A1H3J500_9EURY|nr:CbtA family protein [Halopenitus persicus]SDY34619.1 Probable cobalt transporter subunit (CbtA) [Halopenitus persicus]
MLAEYLIRGVKAGAVAGLVFGLFVAVVAAPTVAFADELGHGDAAIEATDGGVEGGHAHEHAGDDGHSHESGGHAGDEGHAHEDGVSGTVTTVVSVASSVLWGVLLGAVVFGAGFYLLEPLLPGTPGSGVRQAVLAGLGFIAVSGAPWLVLPPRPPGVASSLPVGTRLELYGGMMVLGAACGLTALWAFDRLRHDESGVDGADGADDAGDDRRSTALAAAGALAPFGLLGVAAFLAPTASAESTLPTTLSTGLVGMTVFGQLLLWATLAGAHAWLRRRHPRNDRPMDAVGVADDLDAGSNHSRSAD